MGKKIKRAAVAVSTGGLSEVGGGGVGGLKNALFGAKDPGTQDRNAILDPELYKLTQKIRPMQTKAADFYGKRLGEITKQDPTGLASLVTQRKLKGVTGAADDATRLAQQQVAMRRMGNSAAGLNAIVNAGNMARERAGDIRANMPLLRQQLQDQQMARVGQTTGGLANLMNTRDQSRAFIQGTPSTGRSGGLLGLATGALGAYGAAQAGGDPMKGFQSGLGIGNSVGNMRLRG